MSLKSNSELALQQSGCKVDVAFCSVDSLMVLCFEFLLDEIIIDVPFALMSV